MWKSILVRPSGESCYRYLIPRFKPNFHESLQLEGQTYPPEVCKVSSVYLQVERQHQRFPTLKAALVELDVEGKVFRLSPEEIFFKGQWFYQKGSTLSCALLIHAPSSNPSEWEIIYLPERARRSLMIRLYLCNQSSKFFKPIYPPAVDPSANYTVRLWEVHYPPDLKAKSQYLLTEFSDPKLYKSWMRGKP